MIDDDADQSARGRTAPVLGWSAGFAGATFARSSAIIPDDSSQPSPTLGCLRQTVAPTVETTISAIVGLVGDQPQ
jgi:hypothetical protein